MDEEPTLEARRSTSNSCERPDRGLRNKCVHVDHSNCKRSRGGKALIGDYFARAQTIWMPCESELHCRCQAAVSCSRMQ